jgi:hypothetical protein
MEKVQKPSNSGLIDLFHSDLTPTLSKEWSLEELMLILSLSSTCNTLLHSYSYYFLRINSVVWAITIIMFISERRSFRVCSARLLDNESFCWRDSSEVTGFCKPSLSNDVTSLYLAWLVIFKFWGVHYVCQWNSVINQLQCFKPAMSFNCPSCFVSWVQWPRGLRHEPSSFARTLG